MKGPQPERPFLTDPVRYIWLALSTELREEGPYIGVDMHE